MAGARGIGLPASPEARRLVVALSATGLLLWAGASAILPLLPSYLRAHGSTPGLVGLVMAAYYAASVVTQYPAGRLADRLGARTVIAAGLVVFAVASAGFALASAPLAAVGFRALEGAGAGAVTVASAAAIGALVGPDERGGAFGALYGSQMLALAVGPLVGSVVGATSMRTLFLAACGLSLAALAPVLGALRRTATAAVAHGGQAGPPPPDGTPLGRPTAALVGVALVFAAEGLLGGVYETCWTLLLRLRHATSLEVGLSWTLFAVPFAALSVPAGRLAQRADRRRLALAALASSAAFCALYPTLHAVGLLVGLAVLEATGAVLGSPPALLLLAEAVPTERQGRAQGMVETARTAATAVAAGASGALFGIATVLPFDLAAGVVAVICAVVWRVWRDLPGRVGKVSARPALLLSLEQAAAAPESPARGDRGFGLDGGLHGPAPDASR